MAVNYQQNLKIVAKYILQAFQNNLTANFRTSEIEHHFCHSCTDMINLADFEYV